MQGPQGVVAGQLRVSCGEGCHRRRRGIWPLGWAAGCIRLGSEIGRAKIGLHLVHSAWKQLRLIMGSTARQMAVAFPKALLSDLMFQSRNTLRLCFREEFRGRGSKKI